jgi:hypothetical protein
MEVLGRAGGGVCLRQVASQAGSLPVVSVLLLSMCLTSALAVHVSTELLGIHYAYSPSSPAQRLFLLVLSVPSLSTLGRCRIAEASEPHLRLKQHPSHMYRKGHALGENTSIPFLPLASAD